ncbi:MAG: MFS transporter [Candidatus Rokuibacteriota bacterium]|nr:MAG: MFS transporter [Candidatus Rokubacteria bacterium]
MADSEPVIYSAPVAPALLASTAQRIRPNTKLIALLSVGHFVVDLNQGCLPAMLPFLKSAHQLSYAAVATIVLAANVASSIVQPLFGYFADRTARRWMLPASVLLTGGGFALMGLAPGFTALLALVVAMGLGVAAYHPEAYKTATSVAGEKKATALSWFSLGGNVGIALGPPVITALVTVVGVMGSLGLLLPTLVATMLLLAVLPAFSPTPASRAAAAAAARGVNMPRAMALLILVVTIRSWTTLGFTTFVPFYYIDTLGADPRLVGPLLFVFLGAGAAGTVIAGPLADRWGSRAFMQWVLLAALPFGVLFLLVRGALAFVMLGIFGALLTSSFTVSVVLGQAYLPRNAGTASGLIVGFAIGAGGLGVTALGWVADRYGLPSALWISALMPLLAFATARLLPAQRVHEAR